MRAREGPQDCPAYQFRAIQSPLASGASGQTEKNPQNRHSLPILLNSLNRTIRYYRHRQFAPLGHAGRASACHIITRLTCGRQQQGSLEPMAAQNMKKWIIAGLLVLASTVTARAYEPYYSPDHDMQWFSPVDINFEDLAVRKSDGYFFRYDKLGWAATGERVTFGNTDVTVLSEEIYRSGNTYDEGTPPPQYVIENGLQDAGPHAEFAWGDRYEFGVTKNGNGWSVGIIDGPEVNWSAEYGGGPQDTGFGSIHVNFETPPDYLLGFRNYINLFPPVESGPGVDRFFIDDYDGDGDDGWYFVFIDNNGNGVQDDDDPTIGVGMDYDDSYLFNVTFNQLSFRNVTRTDGIEIMRTIDLSNRHRMVKHQNNQMQLGYGVRFFRLRDKFSFSGTSDLLTGRNFADTLADNQIVGPQIRAQWRNQHHRWTLGVDGRFVFGYNVQDLDQNGILGEGLLPGSPDQPFIAQPTAFNRGRREDDFSPFVELRVDASYQLTSAIALRFGYTAIYVDNISRACQLVQYRLPDMGLQAGGQQDIFINGGSFGLEVVH